MKFTFMYVCMYVGVQLNEEERDSGLALRVSHAQQKC